LLNLTASPSSCPALCRASTPSLQKLSKKDVDGRDKPGHDGGERPRGNEPFCYVGSSLSWHQPGSIADASITARTEETRHVRKRHHPSVRHQATRGHRA